MKFLLISNMYPSVDNPGYGIFVKNVADGLAENGVIAMFKAVIKGSGKSRGDKIRKYIKFFTDIVKGFFGKYDFIYIHFPNQAIPLLKLLYKFRQPKIVINFHGEDLLYADSGLHKKLGQATESFCKKYAAAIVVPSPYFAKIVADKHLIESDKIIVSASGGISKDKFTPKDMSLIGENSDKRLHLGYVGRLDRGKGVLEFLAVVKKLSERGFNYHASIIGYGEFLNLTKSFISENKLDNHVTLIPGVPQSELAEHYQKFDLLVFLSSRPQESLGLTGIESMACGTPVVGSNVGGIASYLCDGENGFMIHDIFDADNIVGVIEKYVAISKSEKLEMYDFSVATGARYHSDKVCKELASDLKEILSNGKN
ncbi:MAG: glycosyltransferase family 4 protein [Muribaculum sp.]|nr:glycosyltransferase family 4 protein [Muribaculum sp.]